MCIRYTYSLFYFLQKAKLHKFKRYSKNKKKVKKTQLELTVHASNATSSLFMFKICSRLNNTTATTTTTNLIHNWQISY